MNENRNPAIRLGCPVLVSTEQNIFYTTGFSTTARRPGQMGYTTALLLPDRMILFCPSNWADVVQKTARAEVRPYTGPISALADAIWQELSDRALSELGFERAGMSLDLYLALEERAAADGKAWIWRDVTREFQLLRLHKSPEELVRLRHAAALACAAMEHARSILRPGVTEMQAVAEIEYFMRKNGSSGTPFTMKVLGGENALRTINLPGERRLQRGEIVLLDFGAILDGYASDWTRSFALGTANADQQELYDLVWRVERSCIEQMRPGVRLSELMEHAFSLLKDHRFSAYFNPFLGHSIGLGSQEWPQIVPGADTVLEEDMVFCMEPGVYVPGVGGVRIEDMVHITAAGPKILTGLQKEEFVLPEH